MFCGFLFIINCKLRKGTLKMAAQEQKEEGITAFFRDTFDTDALHVRIREADMDEGRANREAIFNCAASKVQGH